MGEKLLRKATKEVGKLLDCRIIDMVVSFVQENSTNLLDFL
jgi:hypothetical protein